MAGISTVKAIKNNPIDIKATGRLNKLYVELLKDNPDWGTPERRADLNQFMARLIFCFFAEDTGLTNALLDPTYLMADVEVVATYTCSTSIVHGWRNCSTACSPTRGSTLSSKIARQLRPPAGVVPRPPPGDRPGGRADHRRVDHGLRIRRTVGITAPSCVRVGTYGGDLVVPLAGFSPCLMNGV